MKKYGHIIKFERIRQNLKQVQLSEGVCTPSYLSKIESNSIVPSGEVLDELFNRLNIEPSSSLLSEEEFLEYVRLIYIEAIKFKKKDQVTKYLNEILETQFLFVNPINFHTYIMMIIRLKIMSNNGISNDISSYIFSISKFIDDFTPYQSFLYHSCLGYYYFFKNDLYNSLNSLEKAVLLLPRFKLEECESADFYNIYGNLNLHHNKLIVSLDFLSKAQDYFNKELLLFRAVETYITSAIAYKRAENYDKYFATLSLAEKLAKEENMNENLSHIYANLSTYYSIMDNVDLAIKNNIKSLTLTDDPYLKLRIIYGIILQYSVIYKYDKVVEWCQKGLVEYNSNQNALTKTLHFHFQIHLSIHNEYKDFENIIIEAIQNFEEIKDYRHAHKYSFLLANFYNSAGKYKKATKYFVLANKLLATKENRQFIEDL